MKSVIIIVIIGCLALSSCSVFKRRQENRRSQTDLAVHVRQQRDSLQLRAQGQRLRLLSDDRLEIMEIIPEGRFVYSPDDGFSGEAVRVRLYRKSRQRSVEKDTSAFSLSVGSERAGVDSTLHRQVQQQVEETKKSKPVSDWVYVLVGVGVLLVNFVWKKRG